MPSPLRRGWVQVGAGCEEEIPGWIGAVWCTGAGLLGERSPAPDTAEPSPSWEGCEESATKLVALRITWRWIYPAIYPTKPFGELCNHWHGKFHTRWWNIWPGWSWLCPCRWLWGWVEGHRRECRHCCGGPPQREHQGTSSLVALWDHWFWVATGQRWTFWSQRLIADEPHSLADLMMWFILKMEELLWVSSVNSNGLSTQPCGAPVLIVVVLEIGAANLDGLGPLSEPVLNPSRSRFPSSCIDCCRSALGPVWGGAGCCYSPGLATQSTSWWFMWVLFGGSH